MLPLRRDFFHGVRVLLQAPAFALVSSLTIGLGVGATLVVFGFITAIMTASSPVEDLDHKAAIWSHNRSFNDPRGVVSIADFVEWRRRQQSFDRFAAQLNGAVSLSGIDQPVRVVTPWVTAHYFCVRSVRTTMGRAFAPEEEQQGGARVAINNHKFWRDKFQGRPDTLGREIVIDGRRTTIVGIMPEDYVSRDITLPL